MTNRVYVCPTCSMYVEPVFHSSRSMSYVSFSGYLCLFILCNPCMCSLCSACSCINAFIGTCILYDCNICIQQVYRCSRPRRTRVLLFNTECMCACMLDTNACIHARQHRVSSLLLRLHIPLLTERPKSWSHEVQVNLKCS